MGNPLVIEIELENGAHEVKDPHGVRTLARLWIGHYLDGGGEQNWFQFFEDDLAEVPSEAYSKEMRLVEVMPDGKRLVRWDWKGKPQVPETEEQALLRSLQNDLDALPEAQRKELLKRYCFFF